MTNRDRLHNMSDAELSEWLDGELGPSWRRTFPRRFGISTDLFNERAQTAMQERSYSI